MPSWSPSEPQDGQHDAPPPATPTGEDEVAAARKLLADLFDDEDEPAAADEQPDR